MSISGEISTLPLPDLLQWAAVNRWSGILHVDRSGSLVDVYFHEGRICRFQSDGVMTRFSEHLANRGLIRRDVLDAVARGLHGEKLGRQLVRMELMSEAEVRRELKLHALDVSTSLLMWNDGTFHFSQSPVSLEGEVALPISVDEILLESHRRIDEWTRARTVITSLDLVPVIHPEQAMAALHDEPLQSLRRRVIEAIDGRRTLRDVMGGVGASELELTVEAARMNQVGIIELRKAPVVRDITAEFMLPVGGPDDDDGDDGETQERATVAAEIATDVLDVPQARSSPPPPPAPRTAAPPSRAAPTARPTPTPISVPTVPSRGDVPPQAPEPAVPSRGLTSLVFVGIVALILGVATVGAFVVPGMRGSHAAPTLPREVPTVAAPAATAGTTAASAVALPPPATPAEPAPPLRPVEAAELTGPQDALPKLHEGDMPPVPDASLGLKPTIVIRAVIGADGQVQEAAVYRSREELAAFEQAALVAMKRFRFEPGRREGQPVPVIVNWPVTFR